MFLPGPYINRLYRGHTLHLRVCHVGMTNSTESRSMSVGGQVSSESSNYSREASNKQMCGQIFML
jgi:hypothetical protein